MPTMAPPPPWTGEVRTTWPFVWVTALLFLTHCAARAVIGITKLQQRSDIVRIRDGQRETLNHLLTLDRRATPMNVVLIGSMLLAWGVLVLWARRVLQNHRALGRADDRAFVRSTDFFGIAAMAIRGIDGKVADPTLPRRSRRSAGGRIAATWSKCFVSTFALAWVANLILVTRRTDESLEQAITRLGRSGWINLVEAGLLLATGAVGVLTMIEIGDGQPRPEPAADAPAPN